MWIDTLRYFRNSYPYDPGRRHFGWTYKPIAKDSLVAEAETWHSCRETFHNENRARRIFCYTHGIAGSRGRAVSVFFDKIEDRLGLAVEDRAKFGPTSDPSVMWVQPSKWWWSSTVRRSLFTALLRAGSRYRINRDNVQDAIDRTEYFNDTKTALEHFLAGNVHYHGSGFDGWVYAFEDISEDKLKSMLRTDPRKKAKKKQTA